MAVNNDNLEINALFVLTNFASEIICKLYLLVNIFPYMSPMLENRDKIHPD